MIGRIQRSADFERVLGSPSRARSAHFAVHHLAALPSLPGRRFSTDQGDLSTAAPLESHKPVEDAPSDVAPAAIGKPLNGALPAQLWLGCVVPKRNAKRSVTRALLKRQIRAAFASPMAAGLAPGLWVVRLRAPFDTKQFPSAASDALRAAARQELQGLLAKLLHRQTTQAAPGAPA